ncbi:MAG: acyl carrier protein [Bryobacteraceae bacterium]|nr:acyl carrier protein [Bryobacteraceae bacterium]
MDRRKRILEIIRDVSKRSDAPAPGESLFESGLLDSFALPDLVTALEEAFSVKIPDADLIPRKFDTVERIESYIEGRK